MKVFKEIYDESDLREWAINSGWCLDWIIERLDETKNWDLAFCYIDELELSETELNDFLRFDMGEILDEYEEEEDEEEEDEEEDEEEKTERLFFNVLLDEEDDENE